MPATSHPSSAASRPEDVESPGDSVRVPAPIDSWRSTAADGEAYAAVMRVARKLSATKLLRFGLVPVSPEVAVMPVAVRLAFALMELEAASVLVVDANTRLPALPGLRSAPQQRGEQGFERVELSDNVFALVPKSPAPRGREIPTLQDALQRQSRAGEFLLVDLTGYPELGEHDNAYELLDGIVMVARIGLTTERALERCNQEVPASRSLGVLLVGE